MNPSTENKIVLKNRFILEGVLGQGGMGTVYKALDLRAVEAHDREPYLAIKLLKPELLDDPTFFIAMQREAKKAKSLAHPNIIAVYDFDRDGDYVYLSMELLHGRPLNALIKQYPDGIAFGKAWPLIEGMGAALAHAHRHRIVHLDFKPGNVFVDDQGGVKVLDFGIASRFEKPGHANDDTTVFSPGALQAYSPPYASLERLAGQAPDPRDDVYAFACVVYELLSGKHPFSRTNAKHALDLKAKPAPIASISKGQWKGLLHGLELRQDKRTKSIDQFLQEISPPARSSAKSIAAIAVAGIFVLAASAWFFYLPARNEDVARGENKLPAASLPRLESSVGSVASANVEEPSAPSVGIIQPFKLRLSAERYKVGEQMALFVATEKPLYVTVQHINANGEISKIFPNEYESDHLVRPGGEIRIPNADADYEFTVDGPAGTDRIEAFASTIPLPEAEEVFGADGRIKPEIEALIDGRISLEFPVN